MSAKNAAASVLYDNPGPRGRRNIAIGSALFLALAGLGAYLGIYRPLADAGQFEWTLWAPLLDPSTTEFPQVWQRLGEGWTNTLIAAGMAIVASLVLGTGLAVLRARLTMAAGRTVVSVSWLLNAITRVFVEVFRGLPVILTIFFVSRGLPEFGINLDTRYFLVIGLTLYNMVVIGEILRSGMANLPRGQREAADAIGLSGLQTIRLILLPQAFRIMLPALISQIVVVLKDTSLGFIIAYEEVLRVTGQIIQFLGNPIQMYLVVAVLYILLNYGISRLATYAQLRLARGKKAPKGAAVADVNAPGGPGADAPAGAGGAAG